MKERIWLINSFPICESNPSLVGKKKNFKNFFVTFFLRPYLLVKLLKINLYINLACLYGCMSVCLYPINVKTAEPIGPNFFVGDHE